MKCTLGCCKLQTWRNPVNSFPHKYPKPKGAGVILIHNNHILLVQSYNSSWGFPKGSMNINEEEGETASRELLEETGIFIPPEIILKYGYRIPFSNCVYFVINTKKKFTPDINLIKSVKNNDSSGVGWVNISCLYKNNNLACNRHLRKFNTYISNGIDSCIKNNYSNLEKFNTYISNGIDNWVKNNTKDVLVM